MKRNATTLYLLSALLLLLAITFSSANIQAAFQTTDSPDISSILRTKPTQNSTKSTSSSIPQQQPRLYTLPAHAFAKEPRNEETPTSLLPTQIALNERLIAQEPVAANTPPDGSSKTVLINFNNVSIIEYIRFVSRISNRNFVFDENDLQFNVTIISEEPATIDNIMTALLQELRIHDLMLFEDGNNLIIHKNPKVNAISAVVADDIPGSSLKDSDIVTQVFRLNTLDADKAAALLRPLTSDNALIEVLKDTNQLIVTDISANIEKISILLKSVDAPNSGLVIGQYVSRLTPIDTLIPLAQQIMQPISLDQPLTFVPHPVTNSIFIVSSPFLVERTISILQYLDQDQGATRILNLKDLRLGGAHINPRSGLGTENVRTTSGQWSPSDQGNWIFKPEGANGLTPPEGTWARDYEGKWDFKQGAPGIPGSPIPKGKWVLDKDGNWVYQLSGDENFQPGVLNRQFQGGAALPGGAEKKTKFFLYKLQYRKGDSVDIIIRQIADTLQQNERGNEDLISTLRSVQWLEATNSLVFSGTAESLAKAHQLVKEIDTPMRQVFVEMLLLETTITDSLNYGVSYATDFGGGNTTGSQGFFSGSSPLVGAMTTTGFSNLGQPIGQQTVLVPDGTNLAQSSGFNLGVIGQKITHCGTEFGSIGALVNALHDRTNDRVVMNPKILIEDNTPAEIFVGINTPFRTQSISNDRGSVITSNFEYRDIGTTLKITPYLGNGDIVTLDIEEEDSTIIAGLITNADTASTSPGPTTRVNRTKTRVHIPDTFFLIISGMLQHEATRERNQVPCLGGVPLLGAAFSSKTNTDSKTNLMIFIRPKIIDTEEEIQNITKHQQDVWAYKDTLMTFDDYEVVEALDLFNINKTLHPEDDYDWEDYPVSR